MKMLVIEDNLIYARLVERYLTGLADKIVIVESWDAAEPHLAGNPNIIWIDLLVPGYDESHALRKVTEVRAVHHEAIILVVSGIPDPTLFERAIAAGADAFMDKLSVASENQIISLLILATMRAKERGIDTAKFLERAQQFLNERIAAKST